MSAESKITIPICIVTPQGVVEAPYTASSLADAATKEPQGVYTLGRTFNRMQVLLFDDHLDRLEQSALLEKIALPDGKLDRVALRKALRALIEKSSYSDTRYRITIPREYPEQLVLSLEPFKPVPLEVQQNGARVITVKLERHNPVAKTSAWMKERAATVADFPPGIYEGILVGNEGVLLEGTSSNFYAILNGTLRTADEGVLGGIARRAVLKLAPSILPVDLHPVKITDRFVEAFLTSAGRGVVPIVAIDGRPIGTGQPGPLTLKIRDAYNAWAESHLEQL